MDETKFRKLFNDNYYLSKSYANLFSKILNIKLGEIELAGRTFYCVGNKLVGIHPYTNEEAEELKKKGIGFTRITNEENSLSSSPSIREYNVITRSSYDYLYRNYQKHFRNQVNQSQKSGLDIKCVEKTDEMISQAYCVYRDQITRLNGWLIPHPVFSLIIRQEAAQLHILTYEKKVISYAVVYENDENLYLPLQGSCREFFQLRPNNYVYDYLIRRCCETGKNLHLGSGIIGEGFERFKKDAGAMQLRLETHPVQSKVVIIAAKLWEKPLLKKMVGKGLRVLDGTNAYKKLIYSSLPMT